MHNQITQFMVNSHEKPPSCDAGYYLRPLDHMASKDATS